MSKSEIENMADEALNDLKPNIKKSKALVEIEKINLDLNSSSSDIKSVLQEHKNINEIIVSILDKGVDYGVIPGTSSQTLFQPGADKLKRAFGFTTKYELVEKIFITEPDKEFIMYKYKCMVYHNGRFIDEAFASCNSKEPGKGNTKTTSVYQKINTIDQVAQKRAKVRVIRTLLGVTGIFTQDEDVIGNQGNGMPASKQRALSTYSTCYAIIKDLDEYKDLSKPKQKKLWKEKLLLPLIKDEIVPAYFRKWTDDDCNLIIEATEKLAKGDE